MWTERPGKEKWRRWKREPLKERTKREREGKEERADGEGGIMAAAESQSDEVIIFALWMPSTASLDITKVI